MRRKWIYAALLGAGIAAGAFALSHRPLSVSVIAPETDVLLRLYGLGTVEARVLSKAGFGLAGTLEALLADAGDTVSAGQALARLHSAEQEARVARAEQAVLAAEAARAKAEAAIPRAEAVLAQSEAANRRQQELAKTDTISAQKAEEAQRDLDVATADLAIARADVAVLQAQLEDARASLRLEQALLQKYTLSAPYDARIVTRHAEAGAAVKSGDTVFTLIDPGSIWIQAYIDEERAGQIALEQSGQIRLRSHPQETFSGQVVRIGLESDRVNEERKIWLHCTDCPAEMYLGEQAEVRVLTGRRDRALMVPQIAIRGFDGQSGRVWIVKDGKLDEATLSFGAGDDRGRVEVVNGLPDGAKIVSNPPKNAEIGRAVRVETGAE
ncbi:MAG: efflux RND transporter periplasmic adaptor subunit [Paracoccaceae bacterium]